MMTYNTKRKAEFIEAQKKMEADSLDAARLAYMTGKATQEQIELVEEAIEREHAAGHSTGSSIFTKMPTAISKPSQTAAAATQKVTEAASWPSTTEPAESTEDEKKTGLWAWMTSSLKKEEEGEEVGSSQRRLGWDSLSEEDEAAGVRESDLVRAVEGKAHAAFEREKENQREGGPLDRVGLEGKFEDEQKTKKKGWLW